MEKTPRLESVRLLTMPKSSSRISSKATERDATTTTSSIAVLLTIHAETRGRRQNGCCHTRRMQGRSCRARAQLRPTRVRDYQSGTESMAQRGRGQDGVLRVATRNIDSERRSEMSRSRSNNGKPFYVDVGTSIAAIRCASNHDVIFRYDYIGRPQVIQFAKETCDRMNKEVEFGRSPRNCDVGTAEEQAQRFNMFCFPIKCRECKLYTKEERSGCIFRWLQMPYEEGDAE